MKRIGRSGSAAIAAACAMVVAGGAQGAGFFLPYQGAAAIGNSLAGSAALGEDASTVFFNPAGMSRLQEGMVTIAGHYVDPSFKYSDSGSTGTVAMLRTGNNGGDLAPNAFLPAIYAVLPIGDLRLGLGISAPWGSKTDYDPAWIGRFQAALTDLKTINLNPSLSYRVNEFLSFGAGLNYMQLEAEIQRAQLLGPATEGTAKFEGKDHGYGYNLGVLWEPRTDTRVGLSYRSKVDFTVAGKQEVLTAAGTEVAGRNFDIRADITMPAIAQLSVVHALNDRITLLGDYSYYQWSAIQSLDVKNKDTGALSTSLVLNFRDTKRLSAGVNFRLNDGWMLRGGLAWDQAVVGSATDRTPNQPDGDRTWVSVGARWDVAANHRLDFAYARVIFADVPIDHTVPTSGAPLPTSMTLRGNYDNSANLFAVQYSLKW